MGIRVDRSDNPGPPLRSHGRFDPVVLVVLVVVLGYSLHMARSLREMLLPMTPEERCLRDRQSVYEDIEPYRDVPPEKTGPFVESVLRTASVMMRSRPELIEPFSADSHLLDRERRRWRELLERERRRS